MIVSVRRPGNASQPLRHAVALGLAVLLCSSGLRGAVFFIQTDLQMLNDATQLAQSGWTLNAIAKDSDTSTSQAVGVTAAGSAAGISATLISTLKWESRGGTAVEHRSIIAGTSYNGVLSDFWFTRAMTATFRLSGLQTDGTVYSLRTWHNDSYTINEGFGAGGGTVSSSILGGTILTSSAGLATNLRSTQTDGAFTPSTLTFTASAATTDIIFTRTGGTITALPFNGFELGLATAGGGGTSAVPDAPSRWLLPLGAAALVLGRSLTGRPSHRFRPRRR